MNWDKYDLLISDQGYPVEGITKEILEQNQDEIDALKEEIGLTENADLFSLVLHDDDIHDQVEAAVMIMALNIPPEEAFWKMSITHNSGSCVLNTGTFNEMKKMQDMLKEENYTSEIIKKEKENE